MSYRLNMYYRFGNTISMAYLGEKHRINRAPQTPGDYIDSLKDKIKNDINNNNDAITNIILYESENDEVKLNTIVKLRYWGEWENT